ncbi:ABC transporter permease [bacterium]|nr:ABC transporter permease [bacterium]
MLRQALYVARKDIKFIFRGRETWLWAFFMPIVFFYFIGTITAGGGGFSGKSRLALWRPADAGYLADQLERRLVEQDFLLFHPADSDSFAAEPRRLSLPAAFSDSLAAGRPVQLLYGDDGDAQARAWRRLRVSRAAYGLLADLIVTGEQGAAPDSAALAALAAMPRALSVQVAAAGERRRPPRGFEQAVPGTMVMFTVLVLGTSGAILLVIERRQGLLRRLAYAPLSRGSVVLGKWLGKLALGLIQIAFAIVAGSLIFKVDWGGQLPAVLLAMLVYAALMASFGLLLGSASRSEGQAAVVGVLAANLLGALGGCWWPIEITPPFMQKLALCLPTGWAMDALHRLVSFGQGPASVLPHVFGMALAAALLLALAARIFRYD